MSNNSSRDMPLTIQIVDGVLTISIGVSTLVFAVQQADVWENMPRVIDENVFVRDIQRELEHEDEEGTSMVHEVFDTAAKRAVEEGSLGVEDSESLRGNWP